MDKCYYNNETDKFRFEEFLFTADLMKLKNAFEMASGKC